MPRDVASRNAKSVCDEGRGVGDTRLSVYLDFADAIARLGADTIKARYGNLFDMYKRITDEDPYKVPMRIYPAIHYTMGGLWVDYNLMSNLPGLHVLGEANFSDHGANRLGASALMQGLCDGYFVIPYTLGHYLAGTSLEPVTTAHDAFGEAAASATAHLDRLLAVKGTPLDPRLPPRDRPHPVGQSRHVAHRRRAATGHRRDSHAARRVLAGRLGARRQDLRQPGARLRRAAWPTTSSSASCWRSTRCTAPSRAAGTSARKARRRTARRCATTSTSRTWRPGSSAASARRRRCTRNTLVWENVKPSPEELQVVRSCSMRAQCRVSD